MAMFKTRLGGFVDGEKTLSAGYVETDPSSRYGRFRDVLGKGAMKTVYRAFDEVVGMEMAWNQVKLNDVFGSPDELQRLYSEVHLLKTLNHDNIMKFYTSWIDIDRRTFNFITELFTSGTLREYRKKYKRVDIRAVKNWARQILRGLAHLHGHDPPVIHRDLKCDNVFVNGHLGQVKIGDLGLAAVLRGSQHAHSVIGTPEFMAPELYEEEYDELVDIYSFGMCVLEMLTGEYPYSECSNPAQIYKKVSSGKLPAAFYRIQDAEAQKFVGKCLETASKRLPARELLVDPFLASDEIELLPTPEAKQPIFEGIAEDIVPHLPADPAKTTNMMITGNINPEDDTVFLKVQISDQRGHTRNIYFPFDIMNDTAIDVAMEMVKELEINDLEPLKIAEMIEEEITSLIPSWKSYHQQHSFNYEDDSENDEEIHRAFSSPSSHSLSHASLFALGYSYEPNRFASGNEWLSGELFNNDDAYSQSSMNSYNYSNLNYYSENEDNNIGRAHISTRFCPTDRLNGKPFEKQNQRDLRSCGSSISHRKLSRIWSLVDVRSQLLHRSLVKEIHKRRMFKTVGAVENIGFHEPGLPDDDDQKQGFKW